MGLKASILKTTGTWVVLLAAVRAPLLAQCSVRVAGTVLGDGGIAVQAAEVVFGANNELTKYRALYGLSEVLSPMHTGPDGHFEGTLAIKHPGEYWVFASQRPLGYQNTRIGFYASTPPPRVHLDCGVVINNVVVRIGPKVGKLSIDAVLDIQTKAPIAGATLTVRRVSSPITRMDVTAFSVQTGVNKTPLELDVPSDVPFTYQVQASGYEPSEQISMQLHPLELKSLTIELRRPSSALPNR